MLCPYRRGAERAVGTTEITLLIISVHKPPEGIVSPNAAIIMQFTIIAKPIGLVNPFFVKKEKFFQRVEKFFLIF